MAVQEHPVPSPASGEPPAGAPVTDREPASFRDPANQVFYADGQVLRGLRGQAVADWQALAATRFFHSW